VIRLFTSHYTEPDESRRKELEQCLLRNVENPVVGSVYLWLENVEAPPVRSEKLVTRRGDHRPTYADFIDWIGELDPSDQDLSIICNSDIYFDSSIAALVDGLGVGQCAALSRWEAGAASAAGPLSRNDSQDVWVFRGLLKNIEGDFPVGVRRCDNRFLHELNKAGYRVINPGFSIRTYHLQAGRRADFRKRNRANYVEPPYAYLWPHNLWSLPRILFYNSCHPGAQIGWRLNYRWVLSTFPVQSLRKLAAGVWSRFT